MSKLHDWYKESFANGERWKTRVATNAGPRRDVHTRFFPLSLTFLLVPPSFVCGFAMTYPKQTTRKRGKRSGSGGEAAGAARSAGRTGSGERERDSEGAEVDGRRGWKRAAFAPTHAREVATRGTARSRAPLVREKEECARYGEGYAERSLFFVLFFIVR